MTWEPKDTISIVAMVVTGATSIGTTLATLRTNTKLKELDYDIARAKELVLKRFAIYKAAEDILDEMTNSIFAQVVGEKKPRRILLFLRDRNVFKSVAKKFDRMSMDGDWFQESRPELDALWAAMQKVYGDVPAIGEDTPGDWTKICVDHSESIYVACSHMLTALQHDYRRPHEKDLLESSRDSRGGWLKTSWFLQHFLAVSKSPILRALSPAKDQSSDQSEPPK